MENLQKHKFNFFPEFEKEEKELLKGSLQEKGFDSSLGKVVLFENAILDGWNRYSICKELSINAEFEEFKGTRKEALDFSINANLKRRQLEKFVATCIIVDNEELINSVSSEVEEVANKARKQNWSNQYTKEEGEVKKFTPPKKRDDSKRSTNKIANIAGSNQLYVSEARKLKETDPELFEKAKSGSVTRKEIKQEKKKKELEEKKEILIQQEKEELFDTPTAYLDDCCNFLRDRKGADFDLLLTDPPYSTDINNIESFVNQWLPLALDTVKTDGRGYIFIGAYPKEIRAYLDFFLLRQNKFILDNPLIWEYKNTLGVTPKNKYNLNYQMILHFYSKDSKELDTRITDEMFSVHSVNAPDGRQGDRFHTWQKPINLAKRLIRHSTSKSDSIIDPFCCTGTFLLAAAQLEREAVGCDIDHENLKIAAKRGVAIYDIYDEHEVEVYDRWKTSAEINDSLVEGV